MISEITAEMIEDIFGKHSDSVRFANFCNAVVVAEGASAAPTLPVLSEKPGADGGLDAEWTIPVDLTPKYASPFLSPGWNVFQYKARSVTGSGRERAFSNLRGTMKGAMKMLLNRLAQSKPCCRYSLFTNLQLGLETATKTRSDSLLNTQRVQLKNAISEGSDCTAEIEIIDAAQLAAIVSKHPALRFTYFGAPVAKSWNEAWEAEQRVKDYKVSIGLVGRKAELGEIIEQLNRAATKVIVLSGPSGMGKTRLALEATRSCALSTTVVEVVDELLRTDFRSFSTSKTMRVIVVEDPTPEQVEALARKTVACEGVKLVLTVPTDSRAPVPKLTEHVAIKILPPLKPLNNAEAETLLKTAGLSLDHQALNWVLLQAGGNPEILLSAVELKDEIREKSGDLKKRLHERFCRKIQLDLQLDGVRAIKILSPLLYLKCYGENSELNLVCSALDMQIQPTRLLELLPELERMGYVRRRGNYVSVVPPLFAARLVEDLAAAKDEALRNLFTNLSRPARDRFLERMVTVDLPERSTFWEFVFEENGPLETSYRASGVLDHIDCLARAVPAKTARFLEAKLKAMPKHDRKASHLASTARELAYETESCASGMECLELLALREIEETTQLKLPHVFCECFVDWYHEFPMSYQERAAWVRRLVTSKDRVHRLLGAYVVAFVTVPPQSLSGYSVTARRLGQTPPRRLLRDIFDYIGKLVETRFELTQSEDEEIARIASSEFDHCPSALIGHVPPDQLVAIMEKLVDWSFSGKLNSDVRNIRSGIHWVEERFLKSSKNSGQEEFRDKWTDILNRLAALRERFDSGDFTLRLKVATGSHAFDCEWEQGEHGRVYRYQKKLRALAAEATENPQLMSQAAWNALKDANSHLANEFFGYLGECDTKKHFLALFESETVEGAGKIRFGIYCTGLFRADPAYFESYLERLTKDPLFDKTALVFPIAFTSPTPWNRKLLLKLIADKAIQPIDLTNVFRGGRWLTDVPVPEVAIIMEYMLQTENNEAGVADVISLYLHLDKPMPKELIPLGKRVLRKIKLNLKENYECNQIAIGIARTDLECGFALLEEQIVILNADNWREWSDSWNPFSRYAGHEFWDHLRLENPERAYRYFCTLKNLHDIINDDGKALLDLENHRSILLKIANENDRNAEQIAFAISFKQPGFLTFAYDLLSTRSVDSDIALRLSSTIVKHNGFGTPAEKMQTALIEIESELKDPDLPNHGRAWLERIRGRVQETIKTSRWNDGEHEHLGWQ